MRRMHCDTAQAGRPALSAADEDSSDVQRIAGLLDRDALGLIGKNTHAPCAGSNVLVGAQYPQGQVRF